MSKLLPSRGAALFAGLTERDVLRTLLRPRFDRTFPYVESFAYLQQYTRPKAAAAPRNVISSARVAAPSAQTTTLVHQAHVTFAELDRHLASATAPPALVTRHELLRTVVAAAPAQTLRTLMQYLPSSWRARPVPASAARQLATQVLLRAVDIHAETTHHNGGEQTGIHDYEKFAEFVDGFFTITETPYSPRDELCDLLLRLQAKCGRTQLAMDQLKQLPPDRVSETTLEMVFESFRRARVSRAELESAQLAPALVHEHMTPAHVKYVLPFVSTRDEFYDLLSWVRRSAHAEQIIEKCGLDVKPSTSAAP